MTEMLIDRVWLLGSLYTQCRQLVASVGQSAEQVLNSSFYLEPDHLTQAVH